MLILKLYFNLSIGYAKRLSILFRQPREVVVYLEIEMSNKRPAFQSVNESAFTLQVQPLGEFERRFVQRVMAEMAPDWSVELHGIYNEETILIVLPEDGDDAMGPSFVINRETFGLKLEQVHWDKLTDIGVFASLKDVLSAIGTLLGAPTGFALPNPITVH